MLWNIFSDHLKGADFQNFSEAFYERGRREGAKRNKIQLAPCD